MINFDFDGVFNTDLPMPCMVCTHNLTPNRVPTDIDVGAELGEDSWYLSAPICASCLDKLRSIQEAKR